MSDETPPPPGEPTPPSGDVTPMPPPPPTPTPAPMPASAPPPPAYGTPVPPAPPAYGTPMPGAVVAAPQNGMGTASLIFAILQFVCLGPIASVLAIIFGKIGMNRAKKGLATNGGVAKVGFWLGIVGLILTLIATIIIIIAVVFGVKGVVDSLDMSNNSKTGLSDGNYGMNPNTSVRINDKCSFNGDAINAETNETAKTDVTVVGEGTTECGTGTGTPDVVLFTVTGGVAKIVQVQ